MTIAAKYLNRLKSFDGSPAAAVALQEVELELAREVRQLITIRNPARLEACVTAITEVRNWLEVLEEDRGALTALGMTPGALATRIGSIAAMETLLRLDPAFDVPDVFHEIACDRVRMSILYLITEKPLTKTELSQERGRSLASITPLTKALARAGLTYETTLGNNHLVHLSSQGKRLLDLIRQGHIQGVLPADVWPESSAAAAAPEPVSEYGFASAPPDFREADLVLKEWSASLARRVSNPSANDEVDP